MGVASLPEPTICDMNCFYAPGHTGRHQFESDQHWWERRREAQGCPHHADIGWRGGVGWEMEFCHVCIWFSWSGRRISG